MDQCADTTIRHRGPADIAQIRDVNRAAFNGNGEAGLVERLRDDGDAVVELVADSAGAVVGHILFSRLAVEPPGGARAAALAPLAVRPSHQRRGIGAALVRHGLEACRIGRIAAIIVLGHPHYYPRFGFSATLASSLAAPFSGPAFMALELVPGALSGVRAVRYPAAFRL